MGSRGEERGGPGDPATEAALCPSPASNGGLEGRGGGSTVICLAPPQLPKPSLGTGWWEEGQMRLSLMSAHKEEAAYSPNQPSQSR